MLGMIKMGFSYMNEDIFNNLYSVLVRPLLVYCRQYSHLTSRNTAQIVFSWSHWAQRLD